MIQRQSLSDTRVLVVAVLSTESSYAKTIERPVQLIPDTIQFCISDNLSWRIRTYALDHDIHIYQVGVPGGAKFTARKASNHVKKHYADILSSLSILKIPDIEEVSSVRSILEKAKLPGQLIKGPGDSLFYSPDRKKYRTKSEPK